MAKYLIFLSILMLTACASTSLTGPFARDQWEARQVALQSLQTWRISGRIAVRSGDDGWHADLNWLQEPQGYNINLIGPLGQGRVNVRGNAQGVILRTSEGETYQASDPEQLLEQALGMRIPISGLVYWVRGLPDPQRQADLAGDEQGRLTQLKQAGWVIDYTRYAQVAAMELPARLSAEQDDLKVKLVIKQWDFNPHKLTLAVQEGL